MIREANPREVHRSDEVPRLTPESPERSAKTLRELVVRPKHPHYKFVVY